MSYPTHDPRELPPDPNAIPPVPSVTFPVKPGMIPFETKRLRDYISSLETNAKIAREVLKMVCRACTHEGAKRGYNERDGSWMNPCRHCGWSE